MNTCPRCGCEMDEMQSACPGCLAEPPLARPAGSTASRSKCQNCHHWERYFEAPRDGYCPVFNKSTDRYHGSKCTAYQERYYE